MVVSSAHLTRWREAEKTMPLLRPIVALMVVQNMLGLR